MDGEAPGQEMLKALLARWLSEAGGPLLHSLGPGRRLDPDTQQRMEAILGRDLSEVRIHDTRQAGELARRLQAEAFAVGPRIFAGPERLTPASKDGLALLGHELTHVVQQTQPGVVVPVQQQSAGYSALSLAQPLPPAAGARAFPGQPAEAPMQAQLATTFSSAEPDALETQAQEVEQATREHTNEERTGSTNIDPHEIAERVYRLMQNELKLDRERKAFW